MRDRLPTSRQFAEAVKVLQMRGENKMGGKAEYRSGRWGGSGSDGSGLLM